VLVKTSSNDQHLLPFLAKYIIVVQPELASNITFVAGKLENFDAVIATSNNTALFLNIILKINLLSFEKQKLYCDFKWKRNYRAIDRSRRDIFAILD
jgi:hypothetical protein